MVQSRLRVVIAPGNGCNDVEDRHLWYGWLRDELESRHVQCDLRNFPDPMGAHKDVWLPFMRDHLHCDARTILVGHSTGAVAALRLLQSGVRLAAVVLVSVYHSHLDDPIEKASGYFDEPWSWEEIRRNTHTILQFHSTDDPLVPVKEAHEVHRLLHSSYHEYHDAGHFLIPTVRRILYQLELTIQFLMAIEKSDATMMVANAGNVPVVFSTSPMQPSPTNNRSTVGTRKLHSDNTPENSAT